MTVWQNDPDIIANMFVRYYEDLVGRNVSNRVGVFSCFIRQGPILSKLHQNTLIASYSEKDVKISMFQINSIKSSDPDDYSSGFYKAALEIVGKDVTTAILHFVQNGKLLK
ncbi:hypothetical protein KY290_013574 [Solanum tuberosum]|uniref:Uncharacterized protein n=1 Tax=Solanum tuberosum TaxID=4113 RepID=A0ABQ7VM67_SOLTU|nr:hypothetical protein KY289_013698 [Solanum tuberosum]KAH0717014.1 hypothetical protein KY285_013045 [Solanum tuberosum]KAH0769593.1 hypothetical protein KY290_013574 [Solanum tuberosum]